MNTSLAQTTWEPVEDVTTEAGTWTQDNDHETPVLIVALRMFRVIAGVAIVVLNSFTLFCFLKCGLLRNKTNVYLLSVCLSDLLGGFTFIPGPLLHQFAPHIMTYELSMMNIITLVFAYGLSISSMAFATLETYVRIAHPYLHGRHEDSLGHWVLVVCIWILMFGAASCSTLIENKWHPQIYCRIDHVSSAIYALVVVIVFVVVPLLVIAFCIIRILLIARRQALTIAAANTIYTESEEIKRTETRKKTKLVKALVMVSFISWIPTLIHGIDDVVFDEAALSSLPWTLFAGIAVNSMLIDNVANPFLFQRFSPEVKQAYALICKRNNGIEPSSYPMAR